MRRCTLTAYKDESEDNDNEESKHDSNNEEKEHEEENDESKNDPDNKDIEFYKTVTLYNFRV